MHDHCIKLPLYWFEIGLKDMDDAEAGTFIDAVFKYAFQNELPEIASMTEKQKRMWLICKRDLDYQSDHPRAYKYPDNEKMAIRRSGQYNEWRKAVFERDEYTCQSCGQRGGILNAHHIKQFAKYPDERLNLDNGITLCKDCHRAVHRGEIVID